MTNTKEIKRKFKFGTDRRPWWFLQKVHSKDIEYIFYGDLIVGCRFYNVYTRKEVIINDGQYVYLDMLYAEEPKRVMRRHKKHKKKKT